MALNYSRRRVLGAHEGEDNLVSGMRIVNGYIVEGVSENNRDGFGKQWCMRRENEECFDFGRGKVDWSCSPESASKDILDLLPSDPFGMDISTTVTAITGWLEDLEVDYGGFGGSGMGGTGIEDNTLFAGLHLFWNNAMGFHSFPGALNFNELPIASPSVFQHSEGRGFVDASVNRHSEGRSFVDDAVNFDELTIVGPAAFQDSEGRGLVDAAVNQHSEGRGFVNAAVDFDELPIAGPSVFQHSEGRGFVDADVNQHSERRGFVNAAVNFDELPINGPAAFQHSEGRGFVDAFAHNGDASSSETLVIQSIEKTESLGSLSDGNDRNPHEALFFVLGYLGVKDLLSVDRVCSSLHSAVHTDSLLWRSIHVDQPLNERITDDLLFQLSSKAQGSLQCLCLVECHKITDDGLKRVVESNPQLTKLCVPGCTKISVDGIVNIVKDANSEISAQAIKKLRIGGLYGATCTHFDQLKLLLGSDNQEQHTNRKPLFYNRLNFYLSCDDDRGLDIETCPMCHQPRLVYDCPAMECQATSKHTQVCRACILCIQRCVDCGRCTNENEFQENFYLDLQCSYCFKDPLKSQNKLDEKSHQSSGGRRHNLRHNS